MAKETKETFSGKTKDQTFETFDEKVLTWCRKQFGDNYAKAGAMAQQANPIR